MTVTAFLKMISRNSHEECISSCGGLKENGTHKLIVSDINRRCDFDGIGVFLLEKMFLEA